jgi:hypothetical protein
LAKIKAGNREVERGNQIAREGGDEAEAQRHWDEGERLQAKGQVLLEQARTKQAEYNRLVEEINTLNGSGKSLVEQINQQARAHNNCLTQYAGA